MALLSSRSLSNRCPVCGQANKSCGPSHGTSPIDYPEEEAMPQGPPDVIAEAVMNGYTTQVITHRQTAEENGWPIVKVIRTSGDPKHKKIEAPTAPEPVSGGNSEEAPAEQTYEALYSRAQDLEIRGRSKMSRDQLAAAVESAEKQTEET